MARLRRSASITAAVLVAGLALAASAGVPVAWAAPNCSFDSGTRTLTITLTQDSDGVVLRRVGDSIRVRVFPSVVLLTCGNPEPTVNTTDLISVKDTSAGGDTILGIELGGGPFAPGASDEPGSSDEIEIQAALGAGQVKASAFVRGTDGQDTLRLGRTAAAAGAANLNAGSETGAVPQNDADFTFQGVEYFEAHGNGERDVLSVAGGEEFSDPLAMPTLLAGDDGADLLVGGDGDDQLRSGNGNDDVRGGGGFDEFREFAGGNGDDRLDGGPGSDTLLAVTLNDPLRVDLRQAGPQDTGAIGRDTVLDTENVTSGDGPDVVIGTNANNRIETAGGNDVITGLGGADDKLSAGVGSNDIASYEIPPAGSSQGVNVALAITASQNTGGAGMDALSGFEGVVGSPFADTIYGDNNPNDISVRDGVADTVFCNAGADTVLADAEGTDTLSADCEARNFDVRPDTEILSGPSDLTKDATPTFAFRTTKPGSTFECSLDGGTFSGCSSPQTLNRMRDGAHSLSVRSRDLLGALDLTPAMRTFTVDTARPALARAAIAPRFRLGRRRTALQGRAPLGSSFRYRLSEAATVRIAIQRCRTRAKTAKRCRRWRRVGTLTRQGRAGRNLHPFSGRIRGAQPRYGLHRAIIAAVDRAGNRSRRRQLAFHIVRR